MKDIGFMFNFSKSASQNFRKALRDLRNLQVDLGLHNIMKYEKKRIIQSLNEATNEN